MATISRGIILILLAIFFFFRHVVFLHYGTLQPARNIVVSYYSYNPHTAKRDSFFHVVVWHANFYSNRKTCGYILFFSKDVFTIFGIRGSICSLVSSYQLLTATCPSSFSAYWTQLWVASLDGMKQQLPAPVCSVWVVKNRPTIYYTLQHGTYKLPC